MDLSGFLEGSRTFVQSFITLLSSAIAVLVGVAFIYSGLKKVVEHSRGLRQGQPTVGPVLINLAIGAALVQFSTMMDTIVYTLFAENRENPSAAMSYMPAQVKTSEVLQKLVEAGVWWVAAIGVVAIFRGLILWNDLAKGSNGQGSLGWRGFWHVIFGALCVNFTGVLKLFGSA